MGTNPDYIVRVVNDVEGRDVECDIGVAYKNVKGSITVYLNALPLKSEILLVPVENGE